MTSEQAYAAIWFDLERNAMIGNGNDTVSSEWFYGHGEDNPPKLSIVDLVCRRTRSLQRCKFDLLRATDNDAPQADKAEPNRLSCKAKLQFQTTQNQGWHVIHYPPLRRHSHSETSMKCKAAN